MLLRGTRALAFSSSGVTLVEHRLIDVAERADARALLDEPERHRSGPRCGLRIRADVHTFDRAQGARVQIENGEAAAGSAVSGESRDDAM